MEQYADGVEDRAREMLAHPALETRPHLVLVARAALAFAWIAHRFRPRKPDA